MAAFGNIGGLEGGGGGGVTTFIDLSDTPATYTGNSLLFPRVNAGETALEFVAGGGGAGISTFDATIGAAGADFTTMEAAVTAGNTRILAIDSTTETLDTAVPAAGLFIYIQNNAVIDMAANQFTYAAAADVVVRGDRGTIRYAHAFGLPLFDNGSFTSSIVDIADVIVDNNSTFGDTTLCDGVFYVNNVEFQLANVNDCGLKFTDTALSDSYVDNSIFVGGGTSCLGALDVAAGKYTNLIFRGTFSSASTAVIQSGNDNIIYNNLLFEHDTNAIVVNLRGVCSNIYVTGSEDLNLTLNGGDNLFTNIDLLGGTLDMSSLDNNRLVNVITTGLIDFSDASANGNVLELCRCTTAVSVGGDRNKFTNCDFLGGLTVVSGADDNGIVNCQGGPDGGGGALTITVASGSNRTRIVGCMTDAAISDSGTATQAVANTIY